MKLMYEGWQYEKLNTFLISKKYQTLALLKAKGFSWSEKHILLTDETTFTDSFEIDT